MRTIKFGVIGCGLMGKEFASAAARWCHLTSASAKPEIVAVSDTVASARMWFEEHIPSVKQSVSEYQELLSNPEVEAVYCAVPHNLHGQIYLDIIHSGKHLFAEKPFGIDLETAKQIVAEVEKRPTQLVRCSSEFPFFPAAQRISSMVKAGSFGRIIEVRAGFNHCSDLDPSKPINWKRRNETNGEYGCMGDLGLHVLHLPLRFGWNPKNVRALLSKVVSERPDESGAMVPCETWDNAILACESDQGFPMILETKRISPGDTDTWYLNIYGTENSAEFTTKFPKTLRTMPYTAGCPQAWHSEDLGSSSAHQTITGGIFEFGFSDAILQMWASFIDELAGNEPTFQCATPDEALRSHQLFTAALASHVHVSVEEV